MNKIKRLTISTVFMFFSFCNIAYPIDKKEPMKEYLQNIDPILSKVQIAYRNVSQKLLSLDAGVKEMQSCIDNMSSLIPPEFMKKQHKMILLSFKKLKMGFYLLSRGDKPTSIVLVRKSADLLKSAVNYILDFSKKQGIIKDDNRAKE